MRISASARSRRAGSAALATLALALAAPATVAADPPAAGFSPDTAVVNVPTTFIGEATDEDGTVGSYAWDFDGDGQFDDGNTATAQWTFTELGVHRVWLEVTDDDILLPAKTRVYRDVEVTPPPATPQPDPPTPAPARARLLDPFPVVRFAGSLTRTGVRLRIVSVRAPAGAMTRVTCGGRGCPRKPRALRSTGRVSRVRRFERTYKAGARLVVRVTDEDRIGKYVSLRIRRGKAPARRDACLWPGEPKPRACPPRS